MLDIPEPFGPVVRGLLLTTTAVLWTVLLVRIVGLRGFSKMTAFDFVTTIATGSLIAQAGTRSEWDQFFNAMAAIGGVFLVQWLLAKTRLNSIEIRDLLSNEPVLLVENGEFLEAAMAATRVSRSNILEKLRGGGVQRLSEVKAVVLETTGDISIIQKNVDEQLMQGVQRVETAKAA